MSQELQRKLKAAREKLALSQSQLAEKLGIPLRTLQRWEQDQSTPPAFTLKTIEGRLDRILARK
jgi:DNA-binding transcriptional regulator YiaG